MPQIPVVSRNDSLPLFLPLGVAPPPPLLVYPQTARHWHVTSDCHLKDRHVLCSWSCNTGQEPQAQRRSGLRGPRRCMCNTKLFVGKGLGTCIGFQVVAAPIVLKRHSSTLNKRREWRLSWLGVEGPWWLDGAGQPPLGWMIWQTVQSRNQTQARRNPESWFPKLRATGARDKILVIWNN